MSAKASSRGGQAETTKKEMENLTPKETLRLLTAEIEYWPCPASDRVVAPISHKIDPRLAT